MDGTLVNSIAVVERVWREWAIANGIEPNAFLQRIHGMRASEVIRREAVPGLDVDAEADMILRAEMDDVNGIIQIPGAADFLATLPADKWAIVTSAVRALPSDGLLRPASLLGRHDLRRRRGQRQPDPEGYRKAADRLGVTPEMCVVFEDAPAGIEAGERMGAAVVVINVTHSHR